MKDLCEYLQLYIITEPKYGNIIELSRNVLEGGCRAIQLRLKNASDREIYDMGIKLRNLTNEYSSLLIINDRPDIAVLVEADGVHVGAEDIPPEKIKEKFPELIVGCTVRNLESAIKFEKYVDYLGVGSVFPSKTKEAKVIGLDELKKITESVRVPVIAIGGINLSNLEKVLECGVCGVAVISGIFETPDPCKTTRIFIEKLRKFKELRR